MPGQKHIYDFKDEGGNSLLVTYFGQPQTELWGGLPEYYDEFNVVDVVNPSEYQTRRDTVFQAIGELDTDSRYRSGKAFYMLQPRFGVSEDKLYHMFSHDTTLYESELPSGKVVDQYTIPFDIFILFDGYTMGPAGIQEQYTSKDRGGRIESLNHSKGFEIIVYHSGLKRRDMEEFDRESSDFYDQLEKAVYKKYLLIKDGKRVNKNLRFIRKASNIQFVDDDGVFYATQNMKALEEEPEKYTIYKLRIVEDD